MTSISRNLIDPKELILPASLAVLLVFSSQVSFLLFHTLAEFFAIVVAVLTSVVAWQTYIFTRNHFLMYLGCGYFWIATLDMVHTLSYKGISILPVTDSNVAIQLWIGTRYMEALLLLTAPWFLVRTLNRNIAITLFGVISVALIMLVMSGSFPIAFIEGKGLTTFKVYSEYVIITIIAAAIIYLYRQRKLIDQRVFLLMITSMALTMIAELAFTFYVSVFGLSNLAGHIFKLFSFWLIYLAVVRTTLREPFSALSKAETHYDAVPVATIIVDAENTIQHVNKAACSLADQSVIDLIGKSGHDVFHDINTSQDDCPVCQSIINKTELSAYELQINETTWFELSTSFLQGENSFIEVIRDISSEHKAQLALLDKEHEQRTILQSMVDAVITIDEAGTILSFNQSAEDLFGFAADELIGESVNRLMGEAVASAHNGYLQHYLETGEAHVIGVGREVEGRRKNKDTFPMRLSVAELPKGSTGKRCFIGSCLDLTQIKHQEEQLRRAQKMDALGLLTGGVAHDFNNMLGVMTGYAELLEGALSEQPKLLKYVHEIHRAGERGAKLTKKLLSFSKRVASDAKVLDINTLLRNEQNMLEKTLTARIQLALNLVEDLWPVRLESSDLEDAIINMSINAMHAMEGGGELTLQTYNEQINALDAERLGLDVGDYVVINITDTGSGMDNATREKIFEPFFSTKGKQGTGLGLSQVYGFVERSGGVIKVYSEPGHGTQFVLYFPRYNESTRDDQTVEYNKTVDVKGNETILVVDDEQALLGLASEIISQSGFKVVCAESAKQALHILENEPIDLLLSDVIMPEMDGYQLAVIVKEKYPAIKIQLASGFSDDRHIGVADDTLRQNLLHKPYNSQALLKRIQELLGDEEVHQHKHDVTVSSADEIIKPVEWTEQFSVGIPQIDQDHKVLVSLVNRCAAALSGTNQDNMEISAILDELLDYTQYHFQREELLMKVCEYPHLDNHQQVHQMLIKKVRQHISEFEIGRLTAKALREFLVCWVMNHIMGTDKVIAPDCEGKESRVEQAFKNFEKDHPVSDS